MKYKQYLIFGLIFLLAFVVLSADDTGSERPEGEKRPVKITGVVRLVGSDLFSEIVISVSREENYYVVKDEKEKLFDLQHRTVTVEGDESTSEMRAASGRRTITRRVLQNIKIISIQ
jgi:hypothetical protein